MNSHGTFSEREKKTKTKTQISQKSSQNEMNDIDVIGYQVINVNQIVNLQMV